MGLRTKGQLSSTAAAAMAAFGSRFTSGTSTETAVLQPQTGGLAQVQPLDCFWLVAAFEQTVCFFVLRLLSRTGRRPRAAHFFEHQEMKIEFEMLSHPSTGWPVHMLEHFSHPSLLGT